MLTIRWEQQKKKCQSRAVAVAVAGSAAMGTVSKHVLKTFLLFWIPLNRHQIRWCHSIILRIISQATKTRMEKLNFFPSSARTKRSLNKEYYQRNCRQLSLFFLAFLWDLLTRTKRNVETREKGKNTAANHLLLPSFLLKLVINLISDIFLNSVFIMQLLWKLFEKSNERQMNSTNRRYHTKKRNEFNFMFQWMNETEATIWFPLERS